VIKESHELSVITHRVGPLMSTAVYNLWKKFCGEYHTTPNLTRILGCPIVNQSYVRPLACFHAESLLP